MRNNNHLKAFHKKKKNIQREIISAENEIQSE